MGVVFLLLAMIISNKYKTSNLDESTVKEESTIHKENNEYESITNFSNSIQIMSLVEVYTEAEFQAALKDINITHINLKNNIKLTRSTETADRPIVIDGKGINGNFGIDSRNYVLSVGDGSCFKNINIQSNRYLSGIAPLSNNNKLYFEEVYYEGADFIRGGIASKFDTTQVVIRKNVKAVRKHYYSLVDGSYQTCQNIDYAPMSEPSNLMTSQDLIVDENSKLDIEGYRLMGSVILEKNSTLFFPNGQGFDGKLRATSPELYMKEGSSFILETGYMIKTQTPKGVFFDYTIEKGAYMQAKEFQTKTDIRDGVNVPIINIKGVLDVGILYSYLRTELTIDGGKLNGKIEQAEGSSISIKNGGVLEGEIKHINYGINSNDPSKLLLSNKGIFKGNISGIYPISIENIESVFEGNISGSKPINIKNTKGSVTGDISTTLGGTVSMEMTEGYYKGLLSKDSYIDFKKQKIKLLQTNGTLISEWTPIYSALGPTNKTYKVVSNERSKETSFQNKFSSTGFKGNLIIEPLPDVNLKLDPLNNIPNPTNEYYIKGEATPGSFIKFTGSNIPTPTEVEDTADKTGKYHLKVDTTGKYSYKVTAPFKAGETITADGFLDGNSETVTTVVEEYIRVPDPNLRKAINKELKRINPLDPIRDDNLEYYTKAEMEKLVEVSHTPDYGRDQDKIESLEGIEYGVNIEKLYFNRNSIEDLKPIGNLTKLYDLKVSDNKDVSNNRTLEDISPIKNLVNLKVFFATGNKIKDISSIKDLRVLEEISLTDNQISDIEPLKENRTLKKLFIEVNQISNIEPLKDIQTLENLSISFNRIEDISPIENLTNLKVIDFRKNLIDNVEAVENLVNACSSAGKTDFERLTFSYNKISDISSLESLKNISIKTLEIDENSISDITPLKDIKTLMTLNISKNKISDISSLEDLPKLNLSSKDNFRASNQKVEIGTTKINGYEYELFNMVKTVPTGSISVSNISGSGNIDTSTGLIKWTNLKSDVNPISFSFEDLQVNSLGFSGTVSASIERIVPMNPDNPNLKNNSAGEVPDFTGLGKAELAINYIEPIDFGTVDIESRDMKIESITNTPYVQISDLRETQTDNWELKVRADKLKHKSSGYIIEDASLELNDGEIKGSPSGLNTADIENPDSNKCKLVLGDTQYKSILKKKTNNNIKGTWLKVWKGSGSKNEKVVLNLKGSKARVGSFETTLHWELSIVP